MREKIEVTTELLNTLKVEQLKYCAAMINETLERGWYSDDGYDYLRASLELARELVDIDYEGDVGRLDRMLNQAESTETLQNYACDGICQVIWDLKPPSLGDIDDDEWKQRASASHVLALFFTGDRQSTCAQ
jgi:hypothetical protein